MGLRLGALKPLAILCYIDAAHAVHPDKKSQSGSCIGLGIGNVHWSTAGVKLLKALLKQNSTLLAKTSLMQFSFETILLLKAMIFHLLLFTKIIKLQLNYVKMVLIAPLVHVILIFDIFSSRIASTMVILKWSIYILKV